MCHEHEGLARTAWIAGIEDLRNTGKIVLRGEQGLAERYVGEEEPAGRHRLLDLRERCAVDKVARLHKYAAGAGTGQLVQRLRDIRGAHAARLRAAPSTAPASGEASSSHPNPARRHAATGAMLAARASSRDVP